MIRTHGEKKGGKREEGKKNTCDRTVAIDLKICELGEE